MRDSTNLNGAKNVPFMHKGSEFRLAKMEFLREDDAYSTLKGYLNCQGQANEQNHELKRREV